MPPGEILTSKVQWNNSTILLIGTTHGVPTLHEDIVNKLDNFNPSIVLTEGNSIGNEAVEHRSVRNYNAISGTQTKPLKTLPFEPSGYTNHQDIDEEDITKYGSIDERNAGTLQTKTKLIRLYLKIKDKQKYEKYVAKRDDQMAMKIIYKIEHNNHNKVAVIFGRMHVIGVNYPAYSAIRDSFIEDRVVHFVNGEIHPHPTRSRWSFVEVKRRCCGAFSHTTW